MPHQPESRISSSSLPLATGRILDDRRLATNAARTGTSVAQLCTRYALQHDLVALPKSTHPSRIAENAGMDFRIRGEDMALLDAMDERG